MQNKKLVKTAATLAAVLLVFVGAQKASGHHSSVLSASWWNWFEDFFYTESITPEDSAASIGQIYCCGGDGSGMPACYSTTGNCSADCPGCEGSSSSAFDEIFLDCLLWGTCSSSSFPSSFPEEFGNCAFWGTCSSSSVSSFFPEEFGDCHFWGTCGSSSSPATDI